MNITAYIIDDEAHAVDVLIEYVRRAPDITVTGYFYSALQALEAIRVAPPQLTFLDINMPEISGLEVADQISNLTSVVFTTSFREFGPEAFEKNAVDYLLKPISYERFLKCIHNFRERQLLTAGQTVKEPHHFYVKGGMKGKYIKIISGDICYIESALNYIHIYTTTSRVVTYLSIGDIFEKLPAQQFCRVHRSFIVNQSRVTAVEHGMIRLDDQTLIPLGRSFREDFFATINPSLIVNPKERGG